MKDFLEISYGLNIHKEKMVACILTASLNKPALKSVNLPP